jgi:hypothetical protein
MLGSARPCRRPSPLLETPLDPSLPTSNLLEGRLRPRLMQIAMGDVVRDEALTEALRLGLDAGRSMRMRSICEEETPGEVPTG